MKSLEKNKSVVYALIIFAAAIIAYNTLWKSSQQSATEGISAQNVGNDVLTLNKNLQAVTLDQSIFSSNEFRALTDWSPSLGSANPGRSNPFAPIGQ